MRLLITLFVLLFAQLFSYSASASPQHNKAVTDQRKSHAAPGAVADKKKRKPVNSKKEKVVAHTKEKSKRTKATSVSEKSQTARNTVKKKNATTRNAIKTAGNRSSKHQHGKKAYGTQRGGKKLRSAALAQNNSGPIHLSPQHKKRYQHAKQTAMNKLMGQIGKPYRWGGNSPHTGFDCSGLVYYAYQDLVNIKMPRTANEMYHLRDAAPVKKGELERGDLVFFRIHSRGAADHVGVYLGDGKFIQSPRTGEEIRISSLGDDYWQGHYIGARRVITPKTIR